MSVSNLSKCKYRISQTCHCFHSKLWIKVGKCQKLLNRLNQQSLHLFTYILTQILRKYSISLHSKKWLSTSLICFTFFFWINFLHFSHGSQRCLLAKFFVICKAKNDLFTSCVLTRNLQHYHFWIEFSENSQKIASNLPLFFT